jgi:hypothetical protein
MSDKPLYSWDAYPRVSVLTRPMPLPLDVAATLAGRVRWLRREVEVLDAEIGVKYPPVEIVPVFWLHELRDGTMGDVPGRVTPRPYDTSNRYVVQIAAPALLEYGDDFIVGVLAHEFLHVVFDTLNVAHRAQANPSVRTIRRPGEKEYAGSWSDYRRIDAEWQVEPGTWLTPRLQRLAALAEAIGAAFVDAAVARIKSNWIDKGLPVERIDLKFEVHGIALDPAIIERAAVLATKGGA